MKPVELILAHWDSITEAYSETGSWKGVYDRVQALKAIGFNTVKQYCPIIMEVKQRLDSSNGLNKVIQTELDQVKQKLNRQEELNKVIQVELDKVKQERDQVKQELDRSAGDRELNKVIQDKADTVKQKLNISGWSIQQDRKGYYRAFKKINGKLRAVYLGKSLDGAVDKINRNLCEITGQQSRVFGSGNGIL